MRAFRNALVALCMITAAGSSALWAQSSSGIVFGTVTDPSGAVVSGAAITATNVATGTTLKAVSDDSGNYVLTDLPAASYSLSCSATGFRTLERTGIVLQVD